MSPRTHILRRLINEPLLHFLVIGAALFAAYAFVNRGGNEPAVRQVRVGEGDVRWLRDSFLQQSQREPTPEELRALVRDFVKETLLAREAQELGLDQDDIVVRRRLAQKMTFLIQDTARRSEPSEEELRKLYDAWPQPTAAEVRSLFTRPRISFTHILVSREHSAAAAAAAREALQDLTRPDAAGRGPPHSDRGEAEIRDADERAVANQFGTKFAAAVFGLAPGAWQGPIEASDGLHLVRVSEIVPAQRRPFAEVREQVLERWYEQRQIADEERHFAELLTKYRLVPDPSVKALVDPLIAPPGPAP
jgi:hypothetical protein